MLVHLWDKFAIPKLSAMRRRTLLLCILTFFAPKTLRNKTPDWCSTGNGFFGAHWFYPASCTWRNIIVLNRAWNVQGEEQIHPRTWPLVQFYFPLEQSLTVVFSRWALSHEHQLLMCNHILMYEQWPQNAVAFRIYIWQWVPSKTTYFSGYDLRASIPHGTSQEDSKAQREAHFWSSKARPKVSSRVPKIWPSTQVDHETIMNMVQKWDQDQRLTFAVHSTKFNCAIKWLICLFSLTCHLSINNKMCSIFDEVQSI